MLKIGILGAARVGVYAMLAPARSIPGCEVAAVAARDLRRARDYAAAHRIPKVHADYEALIADPAIDLVYVATPPFNHAELARAAIGAGKPVLVEKPFALNAEQAEVIFRLSSKAGVPAFEAMHSLHHPLLARVQALLKAQAIGAVRRIEARFDAPVAHSRQEFRWRPELGGGALMDLGIYPLAWCRRLTGECFDVRQARADIDGVDTRFEAQLGFAGGVEAVIGGSLSGERHQATLTVEGAQGRLTVDNFLAPHRGHLLTIEQSGGPQREEVVDGPTTYEAQLEAVRATLANERAFPFPIDDYVRSMAAIDRIRSAFARP